MRRNLLLLRAIPADSEGSPVILPAPPKQGTFFWGTSSPSLRKSETPPNDAQRSFEPEQPAVSGQGIQVPALQRNRGCRRRQQGGGPTGSRKPGLG